MVVMIRVQRFCDHFPHHDTQRKGNLMNGPWGARYRFEAAPVYEFGVLSFFGRLIDELIDW